MSNPYRRALLIASLDEIETSDEIILKVLTEHFPEYLTNVLDIVGTAIVNASGNLKNPIKGIFKKQSKQLYGRYITNPFTGEVVDTGER